MEIAASAVAFGQAAKICVQTGHELFRRYKAYKHSDERLTELILRTERSWLMTVLQLELLDKIRDDLDSRLIDCFKSYIVRLEIKFCSARSELETLTGIDSRTLPLDKISFSLTRFKKARYSVFETHIRKTIADLKEWQSEFDPSWLFLTRLTSEKIDLALTKQLQSTPKAEVLENVRAIRCVLRDIEDKRDGGIPVFKDDSFVSAGRTFLQDSNLAATTTTIPPRDVLLDTTTYPLEANPEDVIRQVRDLARILMHGTPSTLGLLQCLGVLKVRPATNASQQYQLIYAVPTNLEKPVSLRHLLSAMTVSLDAKFCLARAMARGVASVHAAGFVHKNIRPDTVLVFHEKGDVQMPVAFLVGFELFRGVHDTTTFTGDMVWYRNLYRHPLRQGQHPDHAYEMQHDIYSLGVCLLEIGLWNSFVISEQTTNTLPKPSLLLSISAELNMNNKRQAALDIKKKLIELANGKLPALMGLMYTEIVMSCLTCLDPNATNMFVANNHQLRDQDGILIGVAFIEKILTRLTSLRLSD